MAKRHRVHLTRMSFNRKTGFIPVSTSSASTCPDSCPLKKGGCYAGSKGSPLGIHWTNVTRGQRAMRWPDFLAMVRGLPKYQLWRHNQAGDLAGKGDHIDVVALRELTAANKGRNGFTYTHKTPKGSNLRAIRQANANGFTVNLSANGLRHADELAQLGLPVATMLPREVCGTETPVLTTPKGRHVTVCPATYRDTTCAECALCQDPDRDTIVGFPAHGHAKNLASEIAKAS